MNVKSIYRILTRDFISTKPFVSMSLGDQTTLTKKEKIIRNEGYPKKKFFLFAWFSCGLLVLSTVSNFSWNFEGIFFF